jgi:hypothetical protein
MTQQYMVGELSSLLAELQPIPGEWRAAVDELRRQVERSAPSELPRPACEAMDLTDMICWAALEQGDVSGFCRCATIAVALRDFTANAGLLP